MDKAITLNMNKKNTGHDISSLPVLLTLHVRSEYLAKQLSDLKGAGIEKVFISIDGPRNAHDKIKQSEIEKILNSHKQEFQVFEIKQSSYNKGIAVAMISAIDWFFSHNTYGVIFEDDITFGSETIQFFALALKNIKRTPNVLLVSGFQPFPTSPPSGHVVFTNYPQIWGWATFAEKWLEMRRNIFRMPSLEQQISLDIRNFWKVGWKRVQRGYLDTWDLPIATGMLFSNKLCMLPPVNLTSNIGVDSYSTNTQIESFPLGLKVEHITCEIITEGISTGPEIYKVNSRFEREIYNIGIKHVFSPALALFDRIRFAKKKKRTLKERMLSTTNL